MTQIFNRHEEEEKRRTLRRSSPETEDRVWKMLRGRRLGGHKFRRQYSVGPYVLDFYCPALRLAVELDGPSHDGDDAQEYDTIRQRSIEALGIRFIRFTNTAVHNNLEGVLLALHAFIQTLGDKVPSSTESKEQNSPSPCEGEGLG